MRRSRPIWSRDTEGDIDEELETQAKMSTHPRPIMVKHCPMLELLDEEHLVGPDGSGLRRLQRREVISCFTALLSDSIRRFRQ
ncbi:hypothetical protein RRG08_022243 [Elysia crispata]|uniref:Uncharacterized protein n=1 Tax=Elysia crispata TaxID=231223 RepID=A0AAE0ZRA7_9GAST|nr:hypothetical protein RRG08_022243 [Elysia crispata]